MGRTRPRPRLPEGASLNDPMLGRHVEIRSVNGMAYSGVVDTIRDGGELGELFELGSRQDPRYRRLVYVVDRLVQIRHLDV
jgi:hypothetical protein